MAKKSNSESKKVLRAYKALNFQQIYDETYESEYAIMDEIKGHYSRYFKVNNSLLLPSQYLEADVDSFVDCNGEG